MPRWTKAMPSNDRLCRLQSRMLSGETPVFGDVGVRSHSITRRSAWPNGSGRISAASASEKMALLTPMPSASVSAATSVNPGADDQLPHRQPHVAAHFFEPLREPHRWILLSRKRARRRRTGTP